MISIPSDVNGVVHCGAHHREEVYDVPVLWIEGNPNIKADNIINAVLWSDERDIVFNI